MRFVWAVITKNLEDVCEEKEKKYVGGIYGACVGQFYVFLYCPKAIDHNSTHFEMNIVFTVWTGGL